MGAGRARRDIVHRPPGEAAEAVELGRDPVADARAAGERYELDEIVYTDRNGGLLQVAHDMDELRKTSGEEWKALFEQTWMRIFSLLAILSLAAHAWIGMWAVLTDYLTERLLAALEAAEDEGGEQQHR